MYDVRCLLSVVRYFRLLFAACGPILFALVCYVLLLRVGICCCLWFVVCWLLAFVCAGGYLLLVASFVSVLFVVCLLMFAACVLFDVVGCALLAFLAQCAMFVVDCRLLLCLLFVARWCQLLYCMTCPVFDCCYLFAVYCCCCLLFHVVHNAMDVHCRCNLRTRVAVGCL